MLFIIIESFSLYLVIQNNSYQKASFINSANNISGNIYKMFNNFTEYLSLTKTNKQLALENAILHQNLIKSYKSNKINFIKVKDSVYQQQYIYILAKVINNSVNKQDNHLTLNKGQNHGVLPDMAVISPEGVVGVVKSVSDNFSSIISVLNENLRISTKIKKTRYFGPLKWDGHNYRKSKLKEIPYHVNINKGDTLITSGYSSIFPEGVQVGTISDFILEDGSNYYDITVSLSTDFKNLSYVYVIKNLLRNEQLTIEKTTKND